MIDNIKHFLISTGIIMVSLGLLYFIPILWDLTNEATTSHMSSFWMGLLFFDILQGGFMIYILLSIANGIFSGKIK